MFYSEPDNLMYGGRISWVRSDDEDDVLCLHYNYESVDCMQIGDTSYGYNTMPDEPESKISLVRKHLYRDVRRVTISGRPADLYINNSFIDSRPGSNMLVWAGEDGIFFWLEGKVDPEEIIKMAQSVYRKN